MWAPPLTLQSYCWCDEKKGGIVTSWPDYSPAVVAYIFWLAEVGVTTVLALAGLASTSTELRAHWDKDEH